MKLSKFAAAIGDTHAQQRQVTTTREQRRKVLHEAWLADVYPHWQGPIAVIAKEPGVSAVFHYPGQHFPDASNGPEVARDIAAAEGRLQLEWLVGEVIDVTTGPEIGVSASILYALAGDVNDCVATRMLAFHDTGVALRSIESSRVATWTGPLEMVVAKMAEDVGRAAEDVDNMLLAALGAREARIADEKRKAKEAEEKRVADEAARVKAEADEQRRKEEAALVESQRLEAKAKAEAEVPRAPTAPAPELATEPAPDPGPPADEAPPAPRRRK